MEETKVPEIFQYHKPKYPEDCIFAISPSKVSQFFEYPRIWYEEQFLGKPQEFKGNTASVLGIIAHYIYECVTLGKGVNREEINDQLISYWNIDKNPDIDINYILSTYPLVVNCVVNEYVLPNDKKYKNVEVEKVVTAEVMPGIYVGGTIDRIEGDMVTDYKNVGVKPNESIIPFMYRIQLLSYVYALRSKGYEINRMRLVYGVRPTKTIPARCIVVTESIGFEDEKLMNNTLKLIGESVMRVKEDPSLAYLIFKSYDLKE